MMDSPLDLRHLDGDTVVSKNSFEAAMYAAGSVCDAVDRVMKGTNRNAFCAVRPPGHHAGPRGVVTCGNDAAGSHGFCLLNNVAIGAAYARHVHRAGGVDKVAIVDIDVHHGNGTEEIVRSLVPSEEKAIVTTPFCSGTLQQVRYNPWLNEEDPSKCMFVSVHGYGKKDKEFLNLPGGWFYPGNGDSEKNKKKSLILDVGMGLTPGDPPGGRHRWRDVYRRDVMPRLVAFNPDLILVSAGFDAHKKDSINLGYIGLLEEDYEWVTQQLVANKCCEGRIVSVLEGGYRVQGGVVSAFGRSVAGHVRALLDGCTSRQVELRVRVRCQQGAGHFGSPLYSSYVVCYLLSWQIFPVVVSCELLYFLLFGWCFFISVICVAGCFLNI
ncbi:unnamed protein product [Choristocarpus tenellus]